MFGLRDFQISIGCVFPLVILPFYCNRWWRLIEVVQNGHPVRYDLSEKLPPNLPLVNHDSQLS